MESTSSFIPQNNLRKKPKKQARRRIYIISYAVYVLFFGTLLTVVGLYAWSLQLESQLAAEQESLSQERASFSESDILRVKELDERLDLMRFVMDGHPSLSKLLTALEDATLENVQVTDFSVTPADDGNNTVLVTFSGAADTFDAVLFQREVMQQNSILSQAEIIDVTYNEVVTEESSTEQGAPVQYAVRLALPIESIAFDGRVAQSNPVVTNDTVPVLADEATTTVGTDTSEQDVSDSAEPVTDSNNDIN